MAEDTYPYPDDEFDELGKNRVPQAVHRAPRSRWRVYGPIIAALVLLPLLAWGLVRLAAGGDNEAGAPATPSPTVVEPTPTDAETAPGEGATEEPAQPEEAESEEPAEPEPEPEPEPVDQSVAVSVLNGASIQGLAGRTQERLQGLGWTNVEAGNYTSAEPTVSTVFYRDAALLPAAEAIAAELGIGPVTELGSVDSITVVLRPDFSE